ncbi:conserved Plasmodium protein, unknown function [Plasmodium knowlesi strain H]|uniref:Leucine-rich repeat protein n=3 Tax=Plasmodium knowlesi TaxID=5850 RepID=A0A5K1VSU7_PLAKH|nr:conserved protein, unknown function [Plasmodium knowlesi strain H]OTN65569.1 Uncharacterized protein PKNOH_S110078100 [Plasmodium knowlesi]CAA9989402.1 conserved protein, unknown function [Plasmodium knowlesi strain H]SBO25003.1 conserved Plasmodium protein, unknown function [Plasmodium knowlesi strain H]SBO27870.1 conserved Plasmodium protein, unknown function [Plasmodium knowlesi strain H]VVS78876.1 conserved protein, unknown function [Plasmodium knowlesi strain H]|eukprot:XP_002260129.1 hypothetical protein, conserved in Plasmodium species [Plasmodium knowlesi strain H]
MASRQKGKINNEITKKTTKIINEHITHSVKDIHNDKIKSVDSSPNKTNQNSEKDMPFGLTNWEISSQRTVSSDIRGGEGDFFTNNIKCDNAKTKFKSYALNGNIPDAQHSEHSNKLKEKKHLHTIIKEKIRKYRICHKGESGNYSHLPEKLNTECSQEDKGVDKSDRAENSNNFFYTNYHPVSHFLQQEYCGHDIYSREGTQRNVKDDAKLGFSKCYKNMHERNFNSMTRLESSSEIGDDSIEDVPRGSDTRNGVNKTGAPSHYGTPSGDSDRREHREDHLAGIPTQGNAESNCAKHEKSEQSKLPPKNSQHAENIIRCNDEELKRSLRKGEAVNPVARTERSSQKYQERGRSMYRRNCYNVRQSSIKNIVNANGIRRDGRETHSEPHEGGSKVDERKSTSEEEVDNLSREGRDSSGKAPPNRGENEHDDDGREDYNDEQGKDEENDLQNKENNEEQDREDITGKNLDEGEWIEIEEPLNFWDALKNNFKNVFLVKSEGEKPTGGESVLESIAGVEKETEPANSVNQIQEFAVSAGPVGLAEGNPPHFAQSRQFPLSPDVYVKCLNYLTVDKILECELLNKLSSYVINNRVNVFTHVKKLTLDEKWSHIPIYKRQFYLHQMKNIKHMYTSEKIYSGNGMYIHEVAAIIFQNVSNLKTLELLSPEYCMNDNTPRHEPFALSPSVFSKLEKLTIIGCQTLEWLHILRNCSFPLLKKLEVCYYPLHHDHWVWKFIFDFTLLGLQGLFKILYTMENLQKLSIGFDVLFDNIEGYLYNPLESHRNALQEFNFVTNNQRYTNALSAPPANGNPSRKFRSYRGRICEEDFSDIFTIAYYISGKCGKLKRIMIKYRDSYDNYEDELDNEETLNEFISEATNTASSYYNYVINWFRSAGGTASERG